MKWNQLIVENGQLILGWERNESINEKYCCLDAPSMNENTKGVKMTVLYSCIVKRTCSLEVKMEMFYNYLKL